MQEELRCIMNVYQLPIRNVTILYWKHAPIKKPKNEREVLISKPNTLLHLWDEFKYYFKKHFHVLRQRFMFSPSV